METGAQYDDMATTAKGNMRRVTMWFPRPLWVKIKIAAAKGETSASAIVILAASQFLSREGR
jgi:hypothetical protein